VTQQTQLTYSLLQYQDPTFVANTAMVAMTMLPSRPLVWATGTYFNPIYDDRNQICIQVNIASDENKKVYRVLTSWLKQNVNTGDAVCITRAKAIQLWNEWPRLVQLMCCLWITIKDYFQGVP